MSNTALTIATRGNTGPIGATGPASPANFYADQFDNPITSDWAVNVLAPASADNTNSGLIVRLFDDTTEEGIGFSLLIPSTATSIVIAPISKATTPAAGIRTIGLKLYARRMPDNAAVSAWANKVMSDISVPATNAYFQYDTETIALTAFSTALIAGNYYQFELTRVNPLAGTELIGDWNLYALTVSFT